MKLALFDFDGTLMKSKIGGHRKRIERVIREIHGIKVSIGQHEANGLTDKLIFEFYLKRNGIIDCQLEQCYERLASVFRETVSENNYYQLPGVRELLEILSINGVLIGALTGNIAKVAEIKLEQAGIKEFFKLGAFGDCPHDCRGDLARQAIASAIREFHFNKEKDNVFLFGDTPLDMEAGFFAGVKTVGVATGICDITALKNKGGHLIVENLEIGRDKILEFMGVGKAMKKNERSGYGKIASPTS